MSSRLKRWPRGRPLARSDWGVSQQQQERAPNTTVRVVCGRAAFSECAARSRMMLRLCQTFLSAGSTWCLCSTPLNLALLCPFSSSTETPSKATTFFHPVDCSSSAALYALLIRCRLQYYYMTLVPGAESAHTDLCFNAGGRDASSSRSQLDRRAAPSATIKLRDWLFNAHVPIFADVVGGSQLLMHSLCCSAGTLVEWERLVDGHGLHRTPRVGTKWSIFAATSSRFPASLVPGSI